MKQEFGKNFTIHAVRIVRWVTISTPFKESPIDSETNSVAMRSGGLEAQGHVCQGRSPTGEEKTNTNSET
jgi:hypothetical protein